MGLQIRPLRSGERAQWEPLWQAYQRFYQASIAPQVTDLTWARLMDPSEPMHALGAFVDETGAPKLQGFVHYLFHRSTWMAGDTCYLQDLFVVPEARGKRIGRALIEAVYADADRRDIKQVYWLTHHRNAAACQLYDRLGVNAGFVLYERFAEVDGDASTS